MTLLESRWTTAALILCSVAGIVQAATNDSLHLPAPGFHELRVISPTVLELTLITTKEPEPAAPTVWNFVNRDGKMQLPKPENLLVSAGGKPVAVSEVGFKRRVAYAPLQKRDLRIGNHLYLKLKESLLENSTVEVKERGGTNVLRGLSFRATVDPRRYSPAIHVNQTGYVPGFPKKAFVGYYLGSLGELEISKPASAALPFAIVDASTGQTNFQGTLKSRPDRGFTFRCYQNVFEADFAQFKTPGEYRMFVPGLGMSFPFYIGDGAAALFARTYALGLYHQRCGTNNVLPYTRFSHGVCHTGLVEIPTLSLTNTQWFLNQSSEDYKSNPRHKAPQLKNTESSLYPFVRRGKIDAAGGHHDAGDYSKYTANSAGLIHTLMTAVDAFTGVAELDNLGLPESGDGISDLLQEAKWEADFLAKLQDDDGGFYFLVYPRERRYENDVEPDRGDPQIVWPKTTAATAAAVAALAQCASSPAMKKAYPDAAKTYLAKARKGWQFLKAALEKYGEDGSYQKITHYGHEFFHDDELAWAACELYLATRETEFHKYVTKWLNPADPGIRKWSWWRMWEGYGCAIRSYALAIKAGKASRQQLDMGLLTKCEDETAAWADELLKWSQESAYGASFPAPTKRARGAGWYFSCDPAFDLAVAAQLDYPSMKDPRPKLMEAVIANLNYEGGANPVNVSYVTGLGWRRQREIVHQTAQNDRRVMPPSGIPLGSIQAGFGWLEHYKRELGALTYPPDSAEDLPYPFYDRWGDSFNLSQEFVVLNQGHGLATWAWLFAQTPLRNQPWKPVPLQIATSSASTATVSARVVASGVDLKGARILWEAEGQEPAFSPQFTVPIRAGQKPWIEAEVQFADGRLGFAATNVTSGNSVRRLSQK